MSSTLEAENLSKIYRNGEKEVRAVDDMGLRLKSGEFLVLCGPSGAGKSTLLHLLGGLDTPTGGRVILDGADMYAMRSSARARIRNRKIGFVFQFYHLLSEFTALENVALPALMKRTAHGARRTPYERAKDLLESVGLGDRALHRPGELSGGESQRVAIARALINDPEILLCDEPTGNLDSKTGGEVITLLLDINRTRGVSLIIATHDESLKEKAGSVIYIKDGKMVR